MDLVIRPPVEPMLAKRLSGLPDGDGWLFEPKWDGFRTLVFRDGDEVLLQSRDLKPMQRYFPELIEPLKQALPQKCVLDGEIVIATDHGLDFEALQLRIHPAASRVKMLSEEIPSSIIFWDLLAEGASDLRSELFSARRARLMELLSGVRPPLHVTPATTERAVAQDWFMRFEGAGLDGVMAKPVSGTYEPGKRSMFKVKHERTCECVVAGFRWHKNAQFAAAERSDTAGAAARGKSGTLVGSLLLGLFDAEGKLHHVGVSASFTANKRAELVEFLAPYRESALEKHPWKDWAGSEEDFTRKPGATSRWSRGKSLSWEPLRPELVVEVAYDHMQGSRFRHTAHFRRWRTDKAPSDCRYDQLEVTAPYELSSIFAKGPK